MQALTTTLYGDTYGVRAENWANAAAPVQQLGEDGDWISTQYQVADFRHDAEAALRTIMTAELKYGGDVDHDAVGDAVEQAEW